jgi:hypothetical protein
LIGTIDEQLVAGGDAVGVLSQPVVKPERVDRLVTALRCGQGEQGVP